VKVGFAVATACSQQDCLVDTTRTGDGNGGHDWGTDLIELDRMALLEYSRPTDARRRARQMSAATSNLSRKRPRILGRLSGANPSADWIGFLAFRESIDLPLAAADDKDISLQGLFRPLIANPIHQNSAGV
jgi:hypothetical protein